MARPFTSGNPHSTSLHNALHLHPVSSCKLPRRKRTTHAPSSSWLQLVYSTSTPYTTQGRAAGMMQQHPVQAYMASCLPAPPDMQGKNPRAMLNAAALAFLGDSVWEVLLRTHVMGAFPATDLHPWRLPAVDCKNQHPPSPSTPDTLLKPDSHAGADTTGIFNTAKRKSTASATPGNAARRKPLSGRDLTIAARLKANAMQQAAYFDHLWATGGASNGEAGTEHAATTGGGLSSKTKSSRSGTGFCAPKSRLLEGSSSKEVMQQSTGSSSSKSNSPDGLSVESQSDIHLSGGYPVSGSSGALHSDGSSSRSSSSSSNNCSSSSCGSSSSRGSDGGILAVCDEPQASIMLTEQERDVLRWGRNSSSVSPPKGIESKAYKKATAVEVLVDCKVLREGTPRPQTQRGLPNDHGCKAYVNLSCLGGLAGDIWPASLSCQT